MPSIDNFVCDRATREPIEGARVVLLQGGTQIASQVTDTSGFVSFKSLPKSANYLVEVCLDPEQHASSWLVSPRQAAPIPPDGVAYLLFRAERKPVVVIGAGAAGLKAANDLLEAGCCVHLFEARGRIGGRAYSDLSLGVAVDLGCQWLHDSPANPWVREAKRLRVKTPRQLKNDYYIDPEHTSDEIERRVSSLEMAIESALENDASDSAASGVVDQLQINREDRWYPTAVARTAALEESAELDEFSAIDRYETHQKTVPNVQIGDPGLREEDNYICPQLGYGGLITKYGNDLQQRFGRRFTLDLNKPVTRIKSTPNGPQVEGSTFTALVAAAVIVAVPTAVVASGGLKFEPPLPRPTKHAFEHLPLGNFNKIALKFSCDIFDPESYETFAFKDKQEKQQIKAFFKRFPKILHYDEIWPRPSLTGNAWKFICNLHGAHVVVGFVGGKFAKQLESESDPMVVEKALAQLRVVLGPCGRFINELYTKEYVISRWSSDPYAGGAYSYTKPGGKSARKHLLGQPLVGDNILFAGEALLPQRYGTAHGAYVTGREAANRALVQMQKQERLGKTGPHTQ